MLWLKVGVMAGAVVALPACSNEGEAQATKVSPQPGCPRLPRRPRLFPSITTCDQLVAAGRLIHASLPAARVLT